MEMKLYYLAKIGNEIILLGKNIPVFIVGDSAYPLQTWLLKSGC